MSYEVIARKWRPKDFSQLVGQSHVSQTLLNALKNERLHHALLFTGPRGTGKTSSARILAKALRCPNAQNFTPCHQCTECEDIAHGRSINVMEIDGASNNGVESIRELRESVGYMPSSGNYKVYIIDEVHMLSTSAFNALLKTLEEPPEHVVFIMATTEVQKIPNTILSRCQRYDFRRIPIKLITEQLSMICKADEINVSEEALWMIARQGDGSLRDSQSLLDQVITFSGKDINTEKVIDILGLTDRALLTQALKALIQRDQAQILELLSQMSTSGIDSKTFIKELLEELRNFLMVKVCGEKSEVSVDLPKNEILYLHELSKELSEEDIHLLFDMTLKGAEDIARSESASIVLEMLLLRMSQAPRIENLLALGNSSPSPKRNSSMSPAQSPSDVSKKKDTHSFKATHKKSSFKSPIPSEAKEQKEDIQKEPTQNTQTQKPAPSQPVSQNITEESQYTDAPAPIQGTESERWHDLVQKVKNINGLIGAQLENTYLKSLENQKVHIVVPSKVKFLFKRMGDADFQKKLLNYISTFWGPGYELEIQMGNHQSNAEKKLTHKQSLELQTEKKEKEIRTQIENHPMVKQTQKYFNAEIQSIQDMKKS